MTTRTSRIFTLSALFAAMIPAMQASAAGFQVAEHSAAGLGRAFAGEAAVANDASVVARNPAGMTRLDSTTVTVVGSYIAPEVKLENSQGSSEGSKSVANEAFVPAAYVVMPVDEKLAVGFGANTNFGFTTNVGSNSTLTTMAEKSEIISMNLNASIAYEFNDRLSAGFGLNAVHTEAALIRGFGSEPGMGPLDPVLANQSVLDIEGDDWGFGWNAGVLFKMTPSTDIGFSYRSEVKQKLEGKSEPTLAAMNPMPGLGDKILVGPGHVDLNLPAIAELSVNHQLTDSVSIQASWMRTYWSSFEEINIDLDHDKGIVEPQNWEDVDRISLGATWQYSDKLALRTGIAKDESPVPNAEHRYFSIPDGDRMWYTVGASYIMDEHHSVDFGYAYLQGNSEDVTHYTGQVIGEVAESSAHIFSAQYNYRF
ncbi:OmpP1/FadL family transporter [Parendozoicomonas haliclonae]|uniref:47 kDa outer membrane protein n=1 Tax=Parendozoicomonas haliclonae TaxID=1960125 RepID=A0A1X7AKG9_9GAMM|nr:outer membrane protein transport protein [Parendozoicomonas haliclonae]SMA47265.1 47 kDa outer membrane protein precursor [Parendozoicomonas haliclonae]